jgi:hypothetical protein
MYQCGHCGRFSPSIEQAQVHALRCPAAAPNKVSKPAQALPATDRETTVTKTDRGVSAPSPAPTRPSGTWTQDELRAIYERQKAIAAESVAGEEERVQASSPAQTGRKWTQEALKAMYERQKASPAQYIGPGAGSGGDPAEGSAASIGASTSAAAIGEPTPSAAIGESMPRRRKKWYEDFEVGDRVRNKKNGEVGRVVKGGHRIVGVQFDYGTVKVAGDYLQLYWDDQTDEDRAEADAADKAGRQASLAGLSWGQP